ncbi:RNA polymerase-binding protein DksA [Pollutimonas bauzanensis]|uniref:RNA polymerase-binding transcription factor DksA n=1 Tax=Pollutimonas bauzanensis TaxID=658167 RepID=A0A1M6BTK4_9BURK|nr:RNA polymerase-binding protein DksA [Pollutimonas bauzanensis]SHI52095.1 transcriptional regulator, TraR/DksA family [Pollutimonas bauzanensis]
MVGKTTHIIESGRLLTEEELLAMPASDYMNVEQLGFFRNRLKELERVILANADATSDNLRGTEFVSDPTDRATIEEQYGLELRTRDREQKLLKKVQQAITRIDSGKYGWCDETGEPIGIARLLARPTANLTLDAQERRELKQKLTGQ